jgi:hypothetical protein
MYKLQQLFVSSKDCVYVAHFVIDVSGCRLIKPNKALNSIEANGIKATLVEWLLPRGVYWLVTYIRQCGKPATVIAYSVNVDDVTAKYKHFITYTLNGNIADIINAWFPACD